MANEALYSNLGDLRVTEMLSKMWLLTLADRTALQQHPALIYMGDAKDSPSLTMKAAAIGWLGADQLAAVAENASVLNTALTDASYTVTVGRRAKAYSPSDLAKMTDVQGVFDPQSFVDDGIASGAMTLTNLIAALGGGFSQSVGSSGVNMTLQNLLDARALMDSNNVGGSLLAILHTRQLNDLRDSLRGETGALEFVPATAEMILRRGPGFQGSYGSVDFFASNQVPSANAGNDRAGMLLGRGSVLWADGSYKADPAVVGFDIAGGKVRVEFERDGRAGQTAVISNQVLGVAEGIDLAGVGIITDL